MFSKASTGIDRMTVGTMPIPARTRGTVHGGGRCRIVRVEYALDCCDHHLSKANAFFFLLRRGSGCMSGGRRRRKPAGSFVLLIARCFRSARRKVPK